MWAVVISYLCNSRHFTFGRDLSRRYVGPLFPRVAVVGGLYAGVARLLCHVVSVLSIAHNSSGSLSADESVVAGVTTLGGGLCDEFCAPQRPEAFVHFRPSPPCYVVRDIHRSTCAIV